MMCLVGEHAILCPFASLSFLPANFFDASFFGCDMAVSHFFNFIEEKMTREVTVEALLPASLAFYLKAGGAMQQHDAGGCFVDVLAAVSTGPDEVFIEIAFRNAQRGHATGELFGLFRADRERAHGKRVMN